jgi:hypothetical protein
MFMAIAAEAYKHPSRQSDYKVWYLEINDRGDVISLGTKTREELIESIFAGYRKHGQSGWRAFLKGASESTTIDVMDFISQSMFDNTHFGTLPNLAEFQETINALSLNFELRAIA